MRINRRKFINTHFMIVLCNGYYLKLHVCELGWKANKDTTYVEARSALTQALSLIGDSERMFREVESEAN